MSSIIKTARLSHRPYTFEDEQALFEVFADYETRTWYPEMDDRAKARAWIEWNLRNYEQFGFGLWALEITDTGTFIGDCGLTYQDVEGRQELEIGYHIVRSERGKGYATEAARACLDYAFRNTSSPSICSIVDRANEPSKRVASRVHTHRRTFSKNGRPTVLFFTPRNAWTEGRFIS